MFDIVIVGGGIVGLTAGLALAKRAYQVAIIDAGSFDVMNDHRVYAINLASQQLFEQLNVWPLLDDEKRSPYRQMYVWDETTKAHIEFDARLNASAELGFIIHESTLKKALLEKINEQKNIQCFSYTSITHVNESTPFITVNNDKNQWQGKLLIIADGAESTVRKLLNVPISSWSYHQHALVATVHTETPHDNTASQVFNSTGTLAFLPLKNPHQCSIVWATTAEHAENLLNQDENHFNQSMTEAFGHKLGQVALISQRFQFPLTMRHVNQYVGKNWLLMGDAAHTIHPLAGLGLNLGLSDLNHWLACMPPAENVIISKKILGRYQRQRKNEVWQLILLLQSLKALFTHSSPSIATLRGLGLDMCNHLPILKRFFIKQASGIIFD